MGLPRVSSFCCNSPLETLFHFLQVIGTSATQGLKQKEVGLRHQTVIQAHNIPMFRMNREQTLAAREKSFRKGDQVLQVLVALAWDKAQPGWMCPDRARELQSS